MKNQFLSNDPICRFHLEISTLTGCFSQQTHFMHVPYVITHRSYSFVQLHLLALLVLVYLVYEIYVNFSSIVFQWKCWAFKEASFPACLFCCSCTWIICVALQGSFLVVLSVHLSQSNVKFEFFTVWLQVLWVSSDGLPDLGGIPEDEPCFADEVGFLSLGSSSEKLKYAASFVCLFLLPF